MLNNKSSIKNQKFSTLVGHNYVLKELIIRQSDKKSNFTNT